MKARGVNKFEKNSNPRKTIGIDKTFEEYIEEKLGLDESILFWDAFYSLLPSNRRDTFDTIIELLSNTCPGFQRKWAKEKLEWWEDFKNH